jgi:hypothetical protein
MSVSRVIPHPFSSALRTRRSFFLRFCIHLVSTRWYPKSYGLVPPPIQQLWWREAPVDVGLPCLVNQCAKLHVAGWTWAVFTNVYLGSCTWPVAIFTLDKRKEQRVCIKFCANLGKSATETLTMIQVALEDQILSRTQAFQWHARFKTGASVHTLS